MQIYVHDISRIYLWDAHDLGCNVRHLHRRCFHSVNLQGEPKSNMAAFIDFEYCHSLAKTLLYGNFFDANVWMYSHSKRRGFSQEIRSQSIDIQWVSHASTQLGIHSLSKRESRLVNGILQILPRRCPSVFVLTLLPHSNRLWKKESKHHHLCWSHYGSSKYILWTLLSFAILLLCFETPKRLQKEGWGQNIKPLARQFRI